MRGIGGELCLIPNCPHHDPKAEIKIPWCPSGGPQMGSLAGMSAVYQCSLSHLDDPEKIWEVRRRIAVYCKQLADMKRLGGDGTVSARRGLGSDLLKLWNLPYRLALREDLANKFSIFLNIKVIDAYFRQFRGTRAGSRLYGNRPAQRA